MCPKPHLSWVMKLTLAHTTAPTASYTCLSHSHTPPARTPTSHMLKHSPTKAQPCSEWSWTTTWQPWKPTSAAFLGSSQCVSGTATTARRRQAFEIHLVTLVASGSPLHSAPLQRSRALATTARRRQALRSVWWTCCGHSRPSHAARTRPRHWARSAWLWQRV